MGHVIIISLFCILLLCHPTLVFFMERHRRRNIQTCLFLQLDTLHQHPSTSPSILSKSLLIIIHSSLFFYSPSFSFYTCFFDGEDEEKKKNPSMANFGLGVSPSPFTSFSILSIAFLIFSLSINLFIFYLSKCTSKSRTQSRSEGSRN